MGFVGVGMVPQWQELKNGGKGGTGVGARGRDGKDGGSVG